MKNVGKAALLPIAVLAAMLGVGMPEAGAQGLFEILFGPPRVSRDYLPQREYRREYRGRRYAVPRTSYSRPRQKITGPSYYVYRPDPLVRVDFTALASAPQTISFEPSLTGNVFRGAVAGLGGFELYAEKDIAKALSDYYSAHPDFIWISGFHANGRAEEAIRVLSEAGSYGLSAADYGVSVPPAAFSLDKTAERLRQLIRFEMALSARVLRYVRDASRGRIDPNRLSGYYDFPVKPLDLANVLRVLDHTYETRTYLESRHPQNPEYQALRIELESLGASAENEIVVNPKFFLRPGENNPDLPKILTLIARNAADSDQSAVLARLGGSEFYVEDLVPVVKAAQERAGLKPDGVIGPRTVKALAGVSRGDRIGKVTLALEQLRWHPSDLGGTRVFINEPAFTASFFEGGVQKLKMRAIVGTKENQTSFFYDEIEQVDYNPYWGVPQSILVNEMLPRLRRDPGYLDRAGYEVTNAKGRRIPSAAVNWWRYGSKIPYNVRQIPSEANALGELKILFPNKHAIYMHDTPQKELFNRDVRAFSHGCVRLSDPRGMAAAVLGTSVDYVAEKLKQGHSSEKAMRKIPVYVAYFTAWPDTSGKVEYFDDIYDRDMRLKEALAKVDELRLPSS